ncbi:MAG: dihydroorotase family protein [Candidatus Freyarchaeota archaeon]|nr:dihydroorotase family protein [Candidatus Jordarchaeia archaeon]
MQPDLIIRNAKFPWRNRLTEGEIVISSGKIIKLCKSFQGRGEKIINASRKIVLPGLIDVHVHLRDLNQAYKEDYYTGTCAAAAGGVTTVLDMPNTNPRTNSAKIIKMKKHIASKKAVVNVGFFSLFPNKPDDIRELAREGVVAFKVYPEDLRETSSSLHIFFEAAAANRKLVAAHPELPLQETYTSPHQFLQLHTSFVETIAALTYTEPAIKTNCQLHLCHITSEFTVEIVKKMKTCFPLLSCEVTPHHLLLTQDALEKEGSPLKVLPPLRSKRDIKALWKAINQGIIDVVASDHAPHQKAEKEIPFCEAASGFPGLETTLPLMLTQLNKGRITLQRLVDAFSERPAQIFRITNKGKVDEGYDADLTIIEPKKIDKIKPENFHSKAKLSPFEGWKTKGKPEITIVNGIVVMEQGEIVAPQGTGRIIEINK